MILVPQPGIEPVSPALGVWNLNHWTAREVPQPLFFIALTTPSLLPVLLMKILATRHIGKPFAIIGPIATAKAGPIVSSSHQGKSLYNSIPGRMISQDNRMLRVESRS